MQEIWKVSSDPYNWKLENNSVLVGFWWAFWLSTEIIATMLFVSITEAHLHYSEFYQRNFPTLITMDVSRIILALLTIILVNVITQKQKKLTE
jgi:high-affinity nickel permease